MNVDIETITLNYANMLDDELLQFASTEGLKLSSDAFLLLREELNRRNIGGDILNRLEHELIFQESIQKRGFREDFNRNLYEESLDYAFSQKEKGASNYDIYVGLIEKGISEEHSNYIVNRIDEWSKKILKDSRLEVQSGFVILMLGLIAVYTSIQIGHFHLAAAMLMLIGIGRVFVFSVKKSTYKRILRHIQMEAGDSY